MQDTYLERHMTVENSTVKVDRSVLCTEHLDVLRAESLNLFVIEQTTL